MSGINSVLAGAGLTEAGPAAVAAGSAVVAAGAAELAAGLRRCTATGLATAGALGPPSSSRIEATVCGGELADGDALAQATGATDASTVEASGAGGEAIGAALREGGAAAITAEGDVSATTGRCLDPSLMPTSTPADAATDVITTISATMAFDILGRNSGTCGRIAGVNEELDETGSWAARPVKAATLASNDNDAVGSSSSPPEAVLTWMSGAVFRSLAI